MSVYNILWWHLCIHCIVSCIICSFLLCACILIENKLKSITRQFSHLKNTVFFFIVMSQNCNTHPEWFHSITTWVYTRKTFSISNEKVYLGSVSKYDMKFISHLPLNNVIFICYALKQCFFCMFNEIYMYMCADHMPPICCYWLTNSTYFACVFTFVSGLLFIHSLFFPQHKMKCDTVEYENIRHASNIKAIVLRFVGGRRKWTK